MNSAAVLIVFTTLLVIAIAASVLMLSTAFHLQYRANKALSDLNCVLSHPEDPSVCDINYVTGGDWSGSP